MRTGRRPLRYAPVCPFGGVDLGNDHGGGDAARQRNRDISPLLHTGAWPHILALLSDNYDILSGGGVSAFDSLRCVI